MAQEHLGNPVDADPTLLGTVTNAVLGGILGAIDADNDTQFVAQFLKAQRDAFNKEMLLDQNSLNAAMTRAETIDFQLEDEGSALRYADPSNGAIYGQIDTWYKDAISQAKTPQSRAAIDGRYRQLNRSAQTSYSRAQQSSFTRAAKAGDYSWYEPETLNDDAKKVMHTEAMEEMARLKWGNLTTLAATLKPIGVAGTPGVDPAQYSRLRSAFPIQESTPEVFNALALAQQYGHMELSALPPEAQKEAMAAVSQLTNQEIARASDASAKANMDKQFNAQMANLGVPELNGMSQAVVPQKTSQGDVYRLASNAIPEIANRIINASGGDPSTINNKLNTFAPYLDDLGKTELRSQILRGIPEIMEVEERAQDQDLLDVADQHSLLFRLGEEEVPSVEWAGTQGHRVEVSPSVRASTLVAQSLSQLDSWIQKPISYLQEQYTPEQRRALIQDPSQLAKLLANQTGIPITKARYVAELLKGNPNAQGVAIAFAATENLGSKANLDHVEDSLAWLMLTEGKNPQADPRFTALEAEKQGILRYQALSPLAKRAYEERAGELLTLVSAGDYEDVERKVLELFSSLMYERDTKGQIIEEKYKVRAGAEKQESTGTRPVLSGTGQEIFQVFSQDMADANVSTKLRQLATIVAEVEPVEAALLEEMADLSSGGRGISSMRGSTVLAGAATNVDALTEFVNKRKREPLRAKPIVPEDTMVNNWKGRFPGNYPMVKGLDKKNPEAESNVLLGTSEFDELHYVHPTMRDGKKMTPEEIKEMIREGGPNDFPIFREAEEALRFSKEEHENFSPDGRWLN